MTDEESEALLAYARALGLRGISDTVMLPVVTADGAIGTAEILIGPASQLIATPVGVHVDLDATEVTAEMWQKARELEPERPVAGAPDETSPTFHDYDL